MPRPRSQAASASLLDPLGDGQHLEVAGDRGQALDEHLGVAGLGDAVDEAAVDLHHVEAEVAEVLEAGGAGAEVVEREGAAAGAHVVHEVDGLARRPRIAAASVISRISRPQAPLPSRAAAARVSSHCSSPIDSGDMLTESRRPGFAAQRLQRVRERQPVDRPAERAALDRRQEGAGRQQLARGGGQPRQHLEERRRPRVPRLHDRLVVEADAALRQRLRDAEPQPRLRLGPPRRRRLAGRRDFEELEGVDRGKLVHGPGPSGWLRMGLPKPAFP